MVECVDSIVQSHIVPSSDTQLAAEEELLETAIHNFETTNGSREDVDRPIDAIWNGPSGPDFDAASAERLR